VQKDGEHLCRQQQIQISAVLKPQAESQLVRSEIDNIRRPLRAFVVRQILQNTGRRHFPGVTATAVFRPIVNTCFLYYVRHASFFLSASGGNAPRCHGFIFRTPNAATRLGNHNRFPFYYSPINTLLEKRMLVYT
jgi:hypothetical protein